MSARGVRAGRNLLGGLPLLVTAEEGAGMQNPCLMLGCPPLLLDDGHSLRRSCCWALPLSCEGDEWEMVGLGLVCSGRWPETSVRLSLGLCLMPISKSIANFGLETQND